MLPKNTPAKVDGRFNDTRLRLLQKAKFAYYSGGYEGLNLQELASSVGVTKPALFNHFKNKQELFFEVLQQICRDQQQIYQEAIDKATDIRSQLFNVLKITAQHPFYDPMRFLADEIKVLNSQQRQEIEISFAGSNLPISRALEMGITVGQLRNHNPRLAIMTFRTLMMLLPAPGNPLTKNIGESEGEIENYINELLDIYLHGLAT